MENDIFYDHNPYNDEGTIGAFCKCGLVLHLPINKLTPPITKIKCPVCKFEMSYISEGVKIC